MRKAASILIPAILCLILPISASAKQEFPIVYVAIGDSLAAGQTPNREIDFGYSDLIAQELSRHMPVALFSKNLSFPGYTSNDVLKAVKSEEAEELITRANLITVSIGANDLLRMIRHDYRSGNLSFQQIQADFALNRVRLNLQEILSELKRQSPQAEIYVMGYYFPYPFVKESQKTGTAKQLDRLNDILKLEAENAGVQFVPVSKEFGQDAKALIPNPADVHPNIEGYRIMANSFLKVMTGGRLTINGAELPIPSPKSFEEIIGQMEEMAAGEATNERTFSPNLYTMVKELHNT